MDKKGLIGLIVFVVVLLIVGFVWFVSQMNEEDNECVKVQDGCCPCNMGGSEKCVFVSEVDDYENNLSDCPEDLVCAAVYSCEIKSCDYVDGECVEVR